MICGNIKKIFSLTEQIFNFLIGGFLTPPAGAAALGATIVNHNRF